MGTKGTILPLAGVAAIMATGAYFARQTPQPFDADFPDTNRSWSAPAPLFVPETNVIDGIMIARWPATSPATVCLSTLDGTNWLPVRNYTASDGYISTSALAQPGIQFRLSL